MGRPDITGDQRELAVVMLANAIRKDAHLRARLNRLREQDNPMHYGMVKQRSEPSKRYVEGMRDLLRILFADGYEVAEECLEEAYIRALGTPVQVPSGDNGTQYH